MRPSGAAIHDIPAPAANQRTGGEAADGRATGAGDRVLRYAISLRVAVRATARFFASAFAEAMADKPLRMTGGRRRAWVPKPFGAGWRSANGGPSQMRARQDPPSAGAQVGNPRHQREGQVTARFFGQPHRRRRPFAIAQGELAPAEQGWAARTGVRALLVVARRWAGCSSEGEGHPPPSDASPSPRPEIPVFPPRARTAGAHGNARPTERQGPAGGTYLSRYVV